MRLTGMVGCVLLAGCFAPIDKGPYGNYCPASPTNEHYCGYCSSTSMCTYCPDVNGKITCPADPCNNKCDSSAGGVSPGGGGGSGGSGGGGSGGSGGGGGGGSGFVCNSTCPAMCPSDAQYECSQYVQNGNCSIQSCTCYGGTPTAYCGIFYRSSTGTVWWCGGGYNESCSSIGVYQCAQTVATACM
jgi:hypothetical protein